jgi:hypothetical protein
VSTIKLGAVAVNRVHDTKMSVYPVSTWYHDAPVQEEKNSKNKGRTERKNKKKRKKSRVSIPKRRDIANPNANHTMVASREVFSPGQGRPKPIAQ